MEDLYMTYLTENRLTRNSVVIKKLNKILTSSKILFLIVLYVFLTNSTFAAIALRGSATSATTTNTTLTINKPTGVVAGDVMIVNICQTGNYTTDASATGWIIIDGANLGNATNRYATVLYRVADGTEGTSFIFTLGSGTNGAIGSIIAFSGVNTSGATPFDAALGTINTSSTAGSTVTALSITTTTANSAIVFLGEANNSTWSNWSGTTPTLTEVMDVQNTNANLSVAAAWGTRSTAGAIGNRTALVSSNSYWGGILIALKAATGSVPTITSLGSTSGCAGSSITINGTNLTGATAANVKIGGTPVTSITSNTGTQIVAVIGNGTTGKVTVTTNGGTAISAATFTVTTAPLAATTPNPANAATGICYAGVSPVTSVSWGTVAGATSYDVYFGAGSLPVSVTSNVITNTYNTGTLLANTTYYWKIVPKNTCGEATGVSTWTFTTANSACYCAINFSNTVYPISNVSFNTLNNTSCNTSGCDASYVDYTVLTTEVITGQSYTISTGGYTTSSRTMYYRVYFDWNLDGDFTDTGESFDIGSTNSGGNVSTSINIPAGAAIGNTRMRVTKSRGSYTASPCGTFATNGQAEDYTVNVLQQCSGTPAPGNTLSSSNPVCPSTPFTLSLQNPGVTAGLTYQWQSSSDGSTWSPITLINTNFTSLPVNTNVYGSASVSGNELVLTPQTNSQSGGFVIQTTAGSNITPFTASFDYRISDGSGADGMSLSYAAGITNDAGGGEEGEGSGIIVKFDTYDNAGGTTNSQIRINYGGTQIWANTLGAFNLRNNSYRAVIITVDGGGKLSLSIGGTSIVSGLLLPGYAAADKTNWKFKFSGRTGGLNDKHSIDNLIINLSTNPTLTTTQSTSTYYRCGVTCSGNTGYSTPILIMTGSVVWDGSESNSWGVAENWTPPFVPISCTDVTIPKVSTNYPTIIAAGATCNNLTLEPGASLLGNSLLTVNAKSDFKLNIENDNTWHFLSSPIANHPIWPEFAPTPSGSPLSFGLAPWKWDFYYFNPNANLATGLFWVNLRMATTGNLNTATVDQSGDNAGFGSNPTFTSGRGYLVAYNSGWNPATGSPKIHSFNGTNPSTFFSGDLTISRTNSSQAFNLVGNPYPSSIDWKENAGWDRNDLKPSSGGFDYWIMTGTGNYGVYNSADLGTNDLTRYIAPAQGFMVEAKDLGTFSFKILEAARVHSSQPWLKNEMFDPGSLKLKITTSANTYSDEMIVAFNSAYTGNGGSAKLFSWYVEAPEIYSVKEGNNFSIDRYNDIQTDITVNINTKTGIDADYTITSTNIADFSLSSKVLLEDLKTGIVTDLKQTPAYTFAGAPGDDANRFRLIIGSPIGIDEPNTNGSFNIYTYENMVYVQNDKINESYFVTVSNMLGQTLVRTDFTGNSLNRIEMQSVPGVYVVNVVSNGKTYSQKVVIR